MRYPTPSDYVEALQFPDLVFEDPELASGEVETNALGLPRVITGAFAAVFRVTSGAGSFAVRGFLSDDPERKARYAAVARTLADADLPWFANFDFQARGIRIGDRHLPLVKMPWVDGENLDRFVERHLHESDVLLGLRDAWRALLAGLEDAGIAHGDLQHGNVLVTMPDGRPQLGLVDYDTVFVPALRGRSSPEVGHRNYQHPDRTERDFDAGIDRFPGIVVYTALTAVAEDPSLWDRFSTGENLLFQSADFYDPASSTLFDALARTGQAAPLAAVLARAALLQPAATPTLEEALLDRAPTGRLASRRRQENDLHRSDRRSGWAQWALPAIGANLLATALLAATGLWMPAAVVVLGSVLAWSALSLHAYRRDPRVRRHQRLAREAQVLEQWIRDLEDELAELARERSRFVASGAQMREDRLAELQSVALERHLKHHFVGELAADLDVGHRAVIKLKQAGIRNAFQAVASRVDAAKDLTSAQRERVAAWRAALAEKYGADVPRELSPVEEQRLRRMVERRLASIQADAARVTEKVQAQRGELARVAAQRDALPRLAPQRFAAYLLRLQPLPPMSAAPPPLQKTSPAGIGGNESPAPDEPWWR